MDAINLQNVNHLLGLSSLSVLMIFVVYILKPNCESPVLFQVSVPEQCAPGWKGEVLEDPTIKISGSAAIQCYNPANFQKLGIVNTVTPVGIDRAVARATEVQIDWAKTSWSQRRRWLKTLRRFIFDNQATIVRAACLDSGKTPVDAYLGEILVTLEKIEWTLKHGERALKPESRPTNLLMFYKANEVRWEPMGVVAASVSWNYPFHNLMSPIISSLFAGNGVILKPSERTAWSSAYFISIARASLAACGHSKELIQACICWPNVAPHLVSHPGISHLTFIGSREVAHEVSKAASRNLVPLCLELGGKDAAIVLDDVADSESELSRVVAILMRGVFQAAGQNCIGIERVIATPKVYPKLLAKLEPLVRNLLCGDPLEVDSVVDIGACISNFNFWKLEALIDDAVTDGARVLVGGHRLKSPESPKGHFFRPTLVADVTSRMSIAQNELFAPVMVLMPASSVDDAIRIANSSPYGLGSSVFGRNTHQLKKVTDQIKAGMVAVNDFAAYYAVQLPFGGIGGSGYARFAGEEGMRAVCNMKSVCKDNWPYIRTAIPGPLQVPYGGMHRALPGDANPDGEVWKARPERRAEQMVRGVVELGYGESISRRLGGLKRTIGV